jgi:CRP-like cAMP-binding protein
LAATKFAIDQTQFTAFSPLDRLAPRSVIELLNHSRIDRLPPGRRLFTRGESDGETIFLLSGQLALLADGPAATIRAQTEEAHGPIGEGQPRLHTAIAHTAATVLCVDSAVLRRLLAGDEQSSRGIASANDIATDTDDRTIAPPITGPEDDAAEQADPLPPLFERLPPMHRRLLRHRMERIEVAGGTELVRQGDKCLHFDLVEHGVLQLRRRGRGGERRLVSGDAVGPEVLLAGGTRHDATVTALEDCIVLRVPRQEFLALIARHYCRRITPADLSALTASGEVTLLDLRSPAAYRRSHMPGSINFPLPLLLTAAPTLDAGRRYALAGDSIRHCAAAAFRLAQHGARTLMLYDPIKTILHQRP